MTKNLLLERYRLIHPLGEGGFAKTYLAEDSQTADCRCVIKHLVLASPSQPLANSSPLFLETARRLFKAEATALRQLGSHDRIPRLLNAFEVDGEFYLVQEYIDGESLDEIFKQQPLIGDEQIMELLTEVLPILTFIHQHNVIHRDIKPSNLMRRHKDGKLMLIDFGAVKAISTGFQGSAHDPVTVSVGTQGYSAPEQLAGRPRYSSDLFSLGMTVIRGLTGRSPTELSENPHTGELRWETDAPNISPGLKFFLQRLTHISVYQRYPSAIAALKDLNQLDRLTEETPSAVPQTVLNPAELIPPTKHQPWKGAIAPALITALILLVRQFGGWVPFELLIYDEWMQRQVDLGQDDRLLLVEVTETDLRELQQPTPSDAVLNQVIKTLQTHNPNVIGLDMYRDVPQGEGHEELLSTLQAENVVTIRKLGNQPSEAIPAPRTMTPERVGFNDFPIDADGVLRRNLLFASTDSSPEGEVYYSFALRLALAYLESQNVVPLASEVSTDYLALNGTTFFPLDRNFGGYRTVDDRGYQLMLQYRSSQNALPRLSLQDVLKGHFTDEMIRDRIIIIGTTAPSAKDLFFTPYSEATETDFLMPGVVLHAQAVSQILRAALGEETLPWAFSETAEIAWILFWAVSGGIAGWSLKRPWVFLIYLVAGSLIVVWVPAAVFTLNGWLPLVPATASLVGSAISAALSRGYFVSML